MSPSKRAIVMSLVFIAICFAILIGYRVMTAQPLASGSSSVVGRSLPETAVVTRLGALETYPLSDEIIGTTVINYFGSWCWPCHAENPALLELRAEGVRIIGIAVRDNPTATQSFLDELGDPFFRVLADREGVSMQALDLGPDIPQTLVVSAEGEILFQHSGPLTGTDGEAALEEIRELAGPR